ncbi:MAG: DNA recombination protein RmuC [Candidatus Margulisiibacteriota bacterium]
MLLFILLALGLVQLGVLVVVWKRTETAASTPQLAELTLELRLLVKAISDTENRLLKDLNTLRTDNQVLAKMGRDEQHQHLSALTQSNDVKLEALRATIEKRLELLQNDNNQKLEQMRVTVDEKLHATLEKRLGESFQLVSNRLELVHKGLGEMQSLATGVGDLKKVLSNVKTRGLWGEIQLSNLLTQFLSPEQFATNVKTKPGSNDAVEFAIKLPGQGSHEVWLPIDAKFPQDAYLHLVSAQDQGNADAIADATKQLEQRLKSFAKDIATKYIETPYTTDFGILFLPTEGLYAEVLRLPGLAETLQQDHRIMVAGPTTLVALLNSLQLGFRTLVIEKRSSEVWSLLGTVKTEFGKFGDLLEKTHKKLQEAGNTIEDAARKTRTIERRLRDVNSTPEPGTSSGPLFTEQRLMLE